MAGEHAQRRRGRPGAAGTLNACMHVHGRVCVRRLRVERGGEQQALALDPVEAGEPPLVRAPVMELLDVVALLDAGHVDEVGDAPHLDEA